MKTTLYMYQDDHSLGWVVAFMQRNRDRLVEIVCGVFGGKQAASDFIAADERLARKGRD
jgi:hypothetical protein